MISNYWEQLQNFSYFKEILITLSLVFSFFYLRRLFFNQVEKNKKITKLEKFKLKKRIKLYSNLVFVLLLFFLWASQIQTIFVSLFAVFAALVIATKELIMCITGGLLVSLNKIFKVGDRIEVDDKRGYVIEKKITSTKILEIGPEKNSQQTTGHIISIPNSLFLSKSVKNESYFQGYSINSFLFKTTEIIQLNELEKHLIENSNSICRPYLEKAISYISKFCEKEGFDIPSIEPRVKIVLDEKNEISLQLKMPVKNSEIAQIEQSLLRGYVDFIKSI